MGVVHKMTKEIEDFILNQKKEQPSLSCRKMVDLVEKTFSVSLSKSSINTLIKNSHLSNPVGRPVERRKRKGFEIPEQRKKQLFPSTDSLPKEQPPLVPVPPPPPSRRETPPFPQKTKPSKPPQERPQASQPGILLDSMGVIFLKAAQWELTDRPFFGPVLRQHCRDKSVADHDVAGEILLYAEAFGIHDAEGVAGYGKQGLWAINGLKEKYPPLALFRAVDSVEDVRSLALDLSIEAPQVFSELLGLKLTLEDGTEILLDGQLVSFWTLNVQSGLSFPTNKVMSYCADKILNNVQSVVLACDQGIKDFTPEFYNFILAMENTPGKRIVNISALDLAGQEMASFSAVPNKKRTFIMGVWPWQEKFGQIKASEGVARLESLNLDGPLSHLFYQEIILSLDRRHHNAEWAEGPALKVRAFLLRKNVEDDPFLAIVTNGSQDKMGAEIVISKYLQRWPNLDQGGIYGQVKQWAQLRVEEETGPTPLIPDVLSSGNMIRNDLEIAFAKMTHPETAELFRLFLGGLHSYCQRKYFSLPCRDFDLELMRSSVYGLPGFLQEEPDRIVCRLVVPRQDFLYLKELVAAAGTVNERDVHDYSGRRLRIEITFS